MRPPERTYYDAFFASPDCQRLDSGVGFRSLRRAQADYLFRRVQRFTSACDALSVGCGSGEIEMLLSARGWRVFAFDCSHTGLAIGRQRATHDKLACLSFGQAYATRLPVSSASCDLVLALSVLHHLKPFERAKALDEAHRVLRNGGVVIAYDPSRWRALRLAKFLVRRRYNLLHSPDEEELSPRQMLRLAQEAGFKSAQVEFFGFFIDPLTWLFPNMYPVLFDLLYRLDRVLVRLPGRQLASNFFLIGQKPSN